MESNVIEKINESELLFIKDNSGLLNASSILSGAEIVAVDVESDSMFHYKEKVCLIQISVSGVNMLIDTLSVKDLSPLKPAFSNPAIRKVFHGADYDIRSLHRDFGIEVNSLFDTQVAARFLGMPQTGLSYCIESLFGIVLEKKYQKKDWSVRPLPKEMIQYAVKDTLYLIRLAQILEKNLISNGRIPWVEEECALLSRVRSLPAGIDPLYLKFKGASKLDPRSLAVLDEILKWREAAALKKDVPPFKILGNHQVLELTEKKPVDIEGLECLSPKQANRFGKSILEAIQTALKTSNNKVTVFPKIKKLKQGAAVLKKVHLLKEWRDRYGKELGLDPSIICPNSLIQSVAKTDTCTNETLKGLTEVRKWQRDLFGEEICVLMNSVKTGQADSDSDR
jgi:ribonuclease D